MKIRMSIAQSHKINLNIYLINTTKLDEICAVTANTYLEQLPTKEVRKLQANSFRLHRSRIHFSLEKVISLGQYSCLLIYGDRCVGVYITNVTFGCKCQK